jgi:hypothetical protein
VVLSSWKEIARHFGKGVRTVQRWERELGLPIHRPVPGKKHSGVRLSRSQKGQQRYLFTCPVVHSQLTRLAQRHVGFLAILVVLQTTALSLRPRMPASWFVASGKNMPPFTLTLFILCMGLGFTEIYTNRSILRRAHLEHPLT